MTVSTTLTEIVYVTDGTSKVFNYPYRVITANDVAVEIDNGIIGIGYTRQLIANGYSGIKFTFSTAPTGGSVLRLRLAIDPTQLTDYVENDPFPAEVQETGLDKLTLLVQQTAGDAAFGLSSAIRVPIAEAPIQTLPTAGVRAGKIVTFDPAGEPIVSEFSFNVGGAAIVVTSIAMLRAAIVPSGAPSTIFAEVTGYYGSNDRGGGQFVWIAASTTADDAGYVIKPNALTNIQPGRWFRLATSEDIRPREYGAVADGVIDDSNATQAAFDRHKVVGGRLFFDAGSYKITRTISFMKDALGSGPNVHGEGLGRSIILYAFANGTSLFKVRNLTSSQFMQGGGFHRIDMQGPLNLDGTRVYGFFTQQAALDCSGWIGFKVEQCGFQNIAGHAYWTPNRNVSVNNNTGIGTDIPNDKPWTYVKRNRPDGRPCMLRARVDPANGAITGFLIARWGSGYVNNDPITVTGCGTGFTGRIKTSLAFTANTTNGSQTITNVPAFAMKRLVFGQQIFSAGVLPANSLVGQVIPGATQITVSDPAMTTSSGTVFTISWEDGGIVDYEIQTPGTGYYEDYEHLFDNPDPFTTGELHFDSNYVTYCDGVGVNIPHFAAGSSFITNNFFVENKSGACLNGSNSIVFENNGVGANGMHPTAGWYPGLWQCRVISNAQNIRVSNNEFDSNTYTHILIDGGNGIEITHNRFNSWVTAWTVQTDWNKQIPLTHIKFENGNNNVGNSMFTIADNCHRWQDAGASVPTNVATIVAGDTHFTAVGTSPLGAQRFKVGGRLKAADQFGNPITFNGGSLTETVITALDPAAQTMDVLDSPDSFGAPGTITVVINQEAVILYDFGRNGNSSTGTIRDPFLGGLRDRLILAANFRSQDALSAQFDYTDGGFRRHGSPGLNSATARLDAAAVVTIPASNVPITIPWNVVYDPENMLEFIPQVFPTPNLYTGRYHLVNSGMYALNGSLVIPGATAGDIFQLEAILQFKSIATTGVVTNNTVTSRTIFFRASGVARESIPITFLVPLTQLETYVGVNAPTQRPSANPATGGEDGLVWWNPPAQTYKRWNGFTGAWDAVTGAYTVPFDLDMWVSVRIRTSRGSTINIDTTSSSYNWLTFSRLG